MTCKKKKPEKKGKGPLNYKRKKAVERGKQYETRKTKGRSTNKKRSEIVRETKKGPKYTKNATLQTRTGKQCTSGK